MGAPVPLGGGSSRPLLLPPHGDEDQGKALGPCMPASFASTQLESDRCRFENPLRFRRMGNCSRHVATEIRGGRASANFRRPGASRRCPSEVCCPEVCRRGAPARTRAAANETDVHLAYFHNNNVNHVLYSFRHRVPSRSPVLPPSIPGSQAAGEEHGRGRGCCPSRKKEARLVKALA